MPETTNTDRIDPSRSATTPEETPSITVEGFADPLSDASGEQFTVTNDAGDVLLAHTMPKAEYMYGCTPTAIGMILGYYDLYGYRGKDFSNLIEGDVELESRGTDGNAYNMDAFDTVLGRAIATEDYVYRFYSRGDIEVITGKKAGSYWTTSGEEELEYSFVNGGEGPEMRTDVWNCIADYLGTGQVWRGNGNLSTSISQATLEEILGYDWDINYVSGDIQRLVNWRYTSMLYGLYLYVEDKGYSLDREITGTFTVDTVYGSFTFEDYKAEIDAGRPVLISLKGHSMVGYGYNPETKEIIFDDCYEADQRMTWGKTYHYSNSNLALQSITVIGLMTGGDADLAVTPRSADSGELFFTADSVPFAAEDYCYTGDAVSVNFTVSNLGKTAVGAFTVAVYVDGTLSKSFAVQSFEGNASGDYTDIPLGSFAPGLYTVRIAVDESNGIQEQSDGNNVLERKLMVLKEGANVVIGLKQVGSGESSLDDYVASGWQLHVESGGTASGTFARGIVTDVAPNGTISYMPAAVVVSRGGLLRDAAIFEYGQVQIGGTAEDLRACDKAEVEVLSGGVLTGRMHFENGAEILMDEGSVLDFDLTRAEAGEAALVNDLSVLRGTPLYTLTVDGTEATGTYALADGAAEFAGTISASDKGGGSLGTFAVGDTLVSEAAEYTLTLTDSILSVTVRSMGAQPSDVAPLTMAWEKAAEAAQYVVEFSADDFEHAIRIAVDSIAMDSFLMPAGSYRWRVRPADGGEWTDGGPMETTEPDDNAPKFVKSNADGNADVFFANAAGTWESGYLAQHVGSTGDWTGTDEYVPLYGRNRLADIFEGSTDANVLLMTDDSNGDALFVDDVFTALPGSVEEQQSRIAKIREIRAGAGNDIVDMTSRQFEYVGGGLTVRGGDGDDTIWANGGDNFLFGDAGDDRIVGASGSDVIAGGVGDDRMHGGGGDDVFAFCDNWGADSVEQLETGTVTLWFASGSESNWNAETLTYTDGTNTVEVRGVTADKVELRFGDDGSARFAGLSSAGAFLGISSEKIYEESGKGVLAAL